jgi:hypothetical protein
MIAGPIFVFAWKIENLYNNIEYVMKNNIIDQIPVTGA